jgi:hypothetical protein
MILGRNSAFHPFDMLIECCTDTTAKRIEIRALLHPVEDLDPGVTGTRDWAIQHTENNDRDVSSRRLGAQDLAYGQSVEVRQQEIQDYDLWRLTPRLAQCLQAGGGSNHLEPLAPKLEVNQVQHVGLIIYYQHSPVHGRQAGRAK